jgi:hypothetical protein
MKITYRSSTKFWATFATDKKAVHISILTKIVWATFWAIFYKLIWTPWRRETSSISADYFSPRNGCK